jgi:hypothetical protein
MKRTVGLKIVGLAILLSTIGGRSQAQQNYFEPTPATQLKVDASMKGNIKKFALYTLKEAQLRTYLANAPLEFRDNATPLPLDVPLPDGTIETFEMVESPVLSPAVAAKHPEIKTYTGKGLGNKSHTIRLSFTSQGFNAIILGINNDAIYYDKTSANVKNPVYRLYFGSDVDKPKPIKAFGQGNKCGVVNQVGRPVLSPTNSAIGGARKATAAISVGNTLRTFRLAMAADAEFTAAKGGTKLAAFGALVAYVNRVIAIYRSELSVSFVLVSDENVVYTNAATDPYTNSNQGTMLDENQANLTNVIGGANYDIGHVLGYAGTSGGGLASLGSVCDNLFKAQGVSGVGDPTQYAAIFDDQLICHEIGHQFAMSHSYNSSIPVCTTREPATSVEPGSGATIMSYGFTCSDDANNISDDYVVPADPLTGTYMPLLHFHTVNYDQAQILISGLACFTATATNNAVPVITQLPPNTVIPKSTPFSLSATATDANPGDVLTYAWEGTNTGGDDSNPPTVTTFLDTTQPPFFRTYEPVSTSTRLFPRLEVILEGTNTARGDKLPSVSIATTHVLTVRDNRGGVTHSEPVTVTITDNSGPFLETTNLSGAYPGNSARTITWSVANTTAPPVSCTAVDILLSTDGGLTFPITLLANTANDGSEPVMLPALSTPKARLKVKSSNNIFFDISDADFSIVAPQVVDCKCVPIDAVRLSGK